MSDEQKSVVDSGLRWYQRRPTSRLVLLLSFSVFEGFRKEAVVKQTTVMFLAILAAVALSTCSKDLTRDDAKRLIASNSLIRSGDDVSIEAISSSSPTESIIRARIAGTATNLKFRRYDSGWVWEFVETKAGGWIAPDMAMAQIRETNRQPRIVEWAAKTSTDYLKTLLMIDRTTNSLPALDSMTFSVAGWLEMRRKMADILQHVDDEWKRNPNSFPGLTADRVAMNDEEVVQLNNLETPDAWGHPVLGNFELGDHKAAIVSLGPDGQQSTPDDVICIVTGSKLYEDGRYLWRYRKHWQVPEGLQNAMADYVSTKAGGTVEYAKLIQP